MSYTGTTFSYKVSRPILSSNWTLRQGGSLGTLTDIPGGGLLLKASAGVNENAITADASLASGAFTLVAGFQSTHLPVRNYCVAGLSLYEVSTTKFLMFGIYSDNLSVMHFLVNHRTGLGGSPTSDSDVQMTAALMPMDMVWLKIIDDGTTNRTYHYSSDGYNFHQLLSHARTVGPTTAFDRVGFMINPFNQPMNMSLFSWKLT